MKTQSIEWNEIIESNGPIVENPIGSLNQLLHFASKAFLALVPAAGILVGAAWLVGMPDLVLYLQVTLWASGFVFMGLALDVDKPGAGLSLLTGIALPVLAVMSSRVAVEIAVIAAALVAIWVAAAIWRR